MPPGAGASALIITRTSRAYCLSVCVFLFLFSGICGVCVVACGCERPTLDIFLHLSSYFLGQGLLLNLELAVLARRAGQQAPGTLQNLPPQYWDHRLMQPFLQSWGSDLGHYCLHGKHYVFIPQHPPALPPLFLRKVSHSPGWSQTQISAASAIRVLGLKACLPLPPESWE